jgi:multiple sugar transport system substrate-binding protein
MQARARGWTRRQACLSPGALEDLAEAKLTPGWGGCMQAGVKFKQSTSACLMAHARDMNDMLVRTGAQPGKGQHFGKDVRVVVARSRQLVSGPTACAVKSLQRPGACPC